VTAVVEARRISVLCMEDDAGLARLLQKHLERTGYRVDLTRDGEEGLTRYDPDRHDIIVVDHVMPVHTGLEVMRILADRGPLPPIIMVTGTGSERVAVEAMKLGAGDYLVKDVDGGYLQLLPTVIEQVLEQRRLAEEKRRADEALRQYAAELEAQNRELDAFAHTVAHDLKNPLHQTAGYAAVMRDECGPQLDSLGCTCLDAISEAVEKMTDIIDALLMLSQVRQDEVVSEALDMERVVEGALERLAPMIEAVDAEIITADGWLESRGYGPWIEEVWVNYVSNAIKYGGRPQEGTPPRVELGCDGSGVQPRFYVRDNGPGLTAEEQARLFTPFTRLEHTCADGHGLGLSIVRRIVEKLGGEVDVESEKGRGSTFSFTLPTPGPSKIT
jgi:signal transduction histidine kinase